MQTLEPLIGLVAALLLLLLAYTTIRYCREEIEPFESSAAYLFEARRFIHSFAGNVGAVFSVTYFFGATFIYGMYLGAWSRIVAALVLVIVTPAMVAVVRVARRTVYPTDRSDGNALLELIRARAPERTFRFIIELYVVIYFALLVEELAITRLVVAKLVDGNTIATAVLVATIAFVVFTYLYTGGFRAVVGADLIQATVLGSFVLILLFLTLREQPPSITMLFPPVRSSPLQLMNALGAFLFGVGWFMAAVDYYSRLNFRRSPENGGDAKLLFVSLFAVVTILVIGTLFGSALQQHVHFTTTVAYVDRAFDFFIHESTAVAAVFITAIFSMLFTTLDTLLVAILQSSAYLRAPIVRRETLLNCVLAALVISTQMPANSTGVVGVFLVSLFALPTLVLCRVAWPKVFAWLPEGRAYLLTTAVLAVLLFGTFISFIEPRFDMHFMITVGIWSLAIMCGVIFRAVEVLRSSFRGKKTRS